MGGDQECHTRHVPHDPRFVYTRYYLLNGIVVGLRFLLKKRHPDTDN